MKLPRLPPLALDKLLNFAAPNYWGVSDKPRFQALMDEALTLVAPGAHFGDNLFTWGRNNSFLEDEAFRTAWRQNIRNAPDESIAWRRYIVACAGYHCVHLAGDCVECGVYLGTGMKTTMDYLGGVDFPKTYWGFDAFEAENGTSFAEEVRTRFAAYPQVKLVEGRLPEAFDRGAPDTIALLHVDLNDLASEIAALERLFDKVVAGGIVILDDYEWALAYRAQKQGEDAWFERRDYRVFPLPTGQGIVLKR